MPDPFTAPESAFAASGLDAAAGQRSPWRWLGWRLQLLVLVALVACVASFLFVRWLAASPQLDLQFQAGAEGPLTVAQVGDPALQPAVGRVIVALTGADGRPVPVDALALQRSPRWQVDDALRERQVAQQERIAAALAGGRVVLSFHDGGSLVVQPQTRGWDDLGFLFWPLAALALALLLTGAVAWLARPDRRNALFLLMAWAQALNLAFIALNLVRGFGLPAGAASADFLPRVALDLATGAAAVHAFALHPRRLPGARWIGAAAWGGAALVLLGLATEALPGRWWWAQGTALALAGAAIATLNASARTRSPDPFAVVIRRFALIATATLALVSLAVATVSEQPGVSHSIGAVGAMAWYVFFASLILLVPFLSRSKQVLREFAMLAGISTVATSLDLLFVAVFSLGQFTSLTLAVFLALGAYAGARQWILNRMLGQAVMTTERTFEQLYRVARDVQQHPERYAPKIEQLMRDLFEPLEVRRLEQPVPQARVLGGGAALVVPVRAGTPGDPARRPLALLLKAARRGQRLFSVDDAKLADRVVQQLRRAVAYDQAVERGRKEERARLAQDLHDDIGARLLTLMYQAGTPEMEDYIRHTLQDLKTLTRGLAAAEHRLSHAAAEWKADLTQRLSAAQVQMAWSLDLERDVRLSVVQWSGLTRVLRELVSNALYHAQASRVEVRIVLAGDTLGLRVADDGCGRAPETWSHGLGLGGVRKRVKQMGGEVHWRENTPRGIACEVRLPGFAPLVPGVAPDGAAGVGGADSAA